MIRTVGTGSVWFDLHHTSDGGVTGGESYGRGGGRVPTEEQPPPAGPAGFPVGSTELVPGQASQVYVQWENLCQRVWPPIRLAIILPAGG